MLQSKLCLDILNYMISAVVHEGRVGVCVPLSDHRKRLGCPETTYYRAVKTLKESGLLSQHGRDRYSIGIWAVDIYSIGIWAIDIQEIGSIE